MQPSTNRTAARSGTLATFSLVIGVTSLLVFFYPPFQLLLGACAIFLAWLSKTPGQRLGGLSIGGIVLGVFAILFSIIVFLNFIAVIHLFDNPDSLIEMIDDPATAALFREFISQYRTLINSMK